MKNDLRGEPRPAIVVIHGGGGWLERDEPSFAARGSAVPGNIVDFAAPGLVAARMNDRLLARARPRQTWKTASLSCAG